MNSVLSDMRETDLAAEIQELAVNRMQLFYGGWPATHRTLFTYPRSRMSLCYHEAGHVVADRAVGLSVESAAVEEDKGTIGGHVYYSNGASDRTDPNPQCPPFLLRLAAIQIATAYLAGYQSELIYHDIELPGCLMLDDSDTHWASQSLRVTYGTAQGLYYVQRLANVILRAVWDCVQAIARELDAKVTLTEADLERLLDDLEPFPAEIFYVPLKDHL